MPELPKSEQEARLLSASRARDSLNQELAENDDSIGHRQSIGRRQAMVVALLRDKRRLVEGAGGRQPRRPIRGGNLDAVRDIRERAWNRLALAARAERSGSHARGASSFRGRGSAARQRLLGRLLGATSVIRLSQRGRLGESSPKHFWAEESVFARCTNAFRRLQARPQCRRHHSPDDCGTEVIGQVEHRITEGC